MTQIQNAKIKSVKLGFEHGILTSQLTLDYGGSGQGFGGFVLYSSKHGTDVCGMWVSRILNTIGVEQWNDLPGQIIRVRREDNWNGMVEAIGHLLEDKWFDPKAEFAAFRAAQESEGE